MIKFGTSGFRGIIGDNFTKENAQKVAFALNEIVGENKTIVLGYDNRFMSKDFAKWICEVLATKNFVKMFNFSVPTPLISWEAKTADLGIEITASHNPYYYNGIKVIKHGGMDSDSEFSNLIEEIANSCDLSKIQTISFDEALKNQKVVLATDINGYCASVKNNIDTNLIKQKKYRVLVNVMHGVATKCIEKLLDELNTDYEIMNKQIDPYFEYVLPAPYIQNLSVQANRIRNENFDFGFAYDADADRFTFISKLGNIYDCNYVSSVVYYYLTCIKKIKGDVVKNKALTNLLAIIAKNAGNEVFEVKNGFKHIGEKLNSTNSILGTESNGIALKNHVMNKDGIMASMLMLNVMAYFDASFEDILEEITNKFNFKSVIREFAYPVDDKKKNEIINMLENKQYPNFKNFEIKFVDDEEGYKIIYNNGYWAMIRFSGNEPVVRIFSEMENEKLCNEMFSVFEKFYGLNERQ